MKCDVIILVRDLMLASRVTASAGGLGMSYQVLRDPAKLLADGGPESDRLIVDLNMPDAIIAAAGWQQQTGRRAVGFVSHVDGETIREAKAAGIGRIMTRGQFVQVVDELLGEKMS